VCVCVCVCMCVCVYQRLKVSNLLVFGSRVATACPPETSATYREEGGMRREQR
jgi:hypothetical protein